MIERWVCVRERELRLPQTDVHSILVIVNSMQNVLPPPTGLADVSRHWGFKFSYRYKDYTLWYWCTLNPDDYGWIMTNLYIHFLFHRLSDGRCFCRSKPSGNFQHARNYYLSHLHPTGSMSGCTGSQHRFRHAIVELTYFHNTSPSLRAWCLCWVIICELTKEK